MGQGEEEAGLETGGERLGANFVMFTSRSG